jgi:hypothetical protein
MPRSDSLYLSAPSLPAYDVDEANRLVDKAFDSRGWLVIDASNSTTHSLDKLRHAIFTTFTTDHIVTSTAMKSGTPFAELAARAAVTKYRLYIAVFPDGPAAKAAPANAEEQAARDHIANYIWRQCTPTNRKAWLQSELADSRLVVLETKVYSTDPGVAPEPGRYVTDVDQAMLDFLEQKVFEDVRRKMVEADQWLATFMQRNPNIAVPASKKAKAALRAAVDSAIHANPTYVKETLAVTAGDDISAE